MNPNQMLTDTLSALTSLNRYHLTIPSCTTALDVEDFSGREGMSQLYCYTIHFTSAEKDIPASQLLRQSVTLTMGTGPLQSLNPQKVVHGVITQAERLGGSPDQARYSIKLQPRLSLLENQFRSHRFFVDVSVPDVVKQVLTEHGFQGWEYAFVLKNTYPKREQINQYQESDLRFIQRLLAEVGIFFFFTLQPDTKTEVVHFGDSQAAFIQGATLPLNSPSGMSDSGAASVWGLEVRHRVAQASVTTKDYNHRVAQNLLQSTQVDMSRGAGEGINYGDVYHYQLRHNEAGDRLDPAPETANFYARLDHERFLAEQTFIRGKSSDATFSPAQIIKVLDALPHTLPDSCKELLLLTSVEFTASRKDALLVAFGAVPYSDTLCWRPELLPRPKVSGTLTARVTSAREHDIYAWQDSAGLYRVKFDADRDNKGQGLESMPVRLAKPYGGDKYGFHFPLIQGTEVAIAFHEGDPDRPYIAHALHDSRHHDHVTEENNTRNVVRTPANNKLRMEDKRGEEHVKLSTEYGGKTQLNLGHNVNAQRELRGEGAELRTDRWVTVRGGAGVFITADMQPEATSTMLEMDAAIKQLEQALALARSMQAAAKGASASGSDVNNQKKLNASLKYLKRPGLLAHAPAGIGILSPETIRIASGGESIGLISGENTDISTGKSFTVSASDAVSLFAQQTGMEIISGGGPLDIQAQGDKLSASAQQDVHITSTDGSVRIVSNQELILTCGEAYIKLSGGNIELGCPGNIYLKSANVDQMGPSSLSTPPITFLKGYSEGFTLKDPQSGEIRPFTRYTITTAEGEAFSGVSDRYGKTIPINTAMPTNLKINFPDEKKVRKLFWTYGEDEQPVNAISKHYTDLNLHAEVENYSPGELVDIEIDLGSGSAKNYQLKVGLNGVAVAKNIFHEDVIFFKDEE